MFYCETVINVQNQKHRLKTLLEFLNKKIKLQKNKPFSFFIILDDASSFKIQDFDLKQVPILIVDMDKETFLKDELFLVPDFYLIGKNFDKKIFKIKNISLKKNFQDKLDIALWRGSQTGGCYSMTTKDSLPRYKLVEFSLNFPNYVDARFTNYELQTEISEDGKNYIKYMEDKFGKNPEKKFIPSEKQTDYKYIISLDGNASAWERIFHTFASESVLLYNTKYIQFFTPYMDQNIHYAPIQEDLSDLKNRIDFLRSNQCIALDIIENTKKFIQSFNSYFFAEFYKTVLTHIQNRS